MKDLDEAKIIIKWEITEDLEVRTLKIDQKAYIQDPLESERITLFYSTIPLIKTSLALFLDQINDH